MATDLSVGDVEVAFLDVTPGDATTNGTLTVTDPAGEDTTPAVTAGAPSGGAVRLTAAAVTYDQAGKWVLHWDVTGVGAGAEDVEVYVNPPPVAGGWPDWGPALADVAGHVPYLTVDTVTPGTAAHLGTFTAATHPTSTQAARHLADAVTSVQATVGTVNESLYGMAKLVASLRAAAAILRAYPRDPNDPNDRALAADLDRRADAELGRLITANEAAGESAIPAAVMPVYRFPSAVSWGDSYL